MSGDVTAVVTEILQRHRRSQNVRHCTGCDWHATVMGRNQDREVQRSRNSAFNEHLAALIVQAAVVSPRTGDA